MYHLYHFLNIIIIIIIWNRRQSFRMIKKKSHTREWNENVTWQFQRKLLLFFYKKKIHYRSKQFLLEIIFNTLNARQVTRRCSVCRITYKMCLTGDRSFSLLRSSSFFFSFALQQHKTLIVVYFENDNHVPKSVRERTKFLTRKFISDLRVKVPRVTNEKSNETLGQQVSVKEISRFRSYQLKYQFRIWRS